MLKMHAAMQHPAANVGMQYAGVSVVHVMHSSIHCGLCKCSNHYSVSVSEFCLLFFASSLIATSRTIYCKCWQEHPDSTDTVQCVLCCHYCCTHSIMGTRAPQVMYLPEIFALFVARLICQPSLVVGLSEEAPCEQSCLPFKT